MRLEGLKSESGSTLPVTVAALAAVSTVAWLISSAGWLASERLAANHAAYELVVQAAAHAFSGVPPCAGLKAQRDYELVSCEVGDGEVEVQVRSQNRLPFGLEVIGQAREGWVTWE